MVLLIAVLLLFSACGRLIEPKYNIRVMPTQVSLNQSGNELFRHEGFYPKEQLTKMLD